MPVVPTYDSFRVGASQAPTPGFSTPNAHPELVGQFGKEMGQDLVQMSHVTSQIGEQMAVQDSRAQDVEFTQGLNNILHDPNNGYLTTSGKNALDAYQPTNDKIAQFKSDQLDKLNSPESKAIANHIFSDRIASASVTMQNHAATQNHNWQINTSQSRAEVSLQDAASNYQDQESFNKSLGTAHEEADIQGHLQGWDAKTIELQKRNYTDKAFTDRYKAWQQSDPVGALQHFQSSQGAMTPLQRDRMGDDLFNTAAPLLAIQVNNDGGVGKVESLHSADPSQPRGIRNNNPGNISMSGNDKWQGQVQGLDARYATFDTPEAGIRAMSKTLNSYQNNHGINTVEGAISRWAPASENDTNSYIATVAKAIGVKPTDNIDLQSPEIQAKMIPAMIKVENGHQPYSDQQISAGISGVMPEKSEVKTIDAESKSWKDPTIQTGNSVIDALPPDKKLKVLQMAQSQARQDMSGLRDALNSQTKDAEAEYLTNGTATNPPKQADFIKAFGQDEGVRRYQGLKDTATFGGQLQQVKNMPNADANQLLIDSKPVPGEGYALRAKNYSLLQAAVQHTQTVRDKDPVGVALTNPAYGIAPIQNWGNPQDVSDNFKKRFDAMPKIASDYGTTPAILSNDEAEAFGKFAESLQPEEKAAMLGNMVSSSSPAAIASISRQLKDKHDTLSIAAMLSSYQEPDEKGFFSGTTPGRNAATLYLQGKDAIEQKRVKIDNMAEEGTKASIFKAIDGVYQTPQGRDAAAEAAYGIWAKYQADGNGNVNKAVDIATGGIKQHNGKAIAKPYGWSDSQFSDALISEKTKANIFFAGNQFNVGGHKVDAEQFTKMLPGARLQTYGSGTYLVMSGNDVVRGKDNAPFILDVTGKSPAPANPEPPNGWEKIPGEYDTAGYVAKYGQPYQKKGQHLTDEFKLPNHYTFSTESRYSNPTRQGGEWSGSDKNGWTFIPSAHNLKTHTRKELEDYFRNIEHKGTSIQFPDGKRVEGTK